jgi:hypothetical protein
MSLAGMAITDPRSTRRAYHCCRVEAIASMTESWLPDRSPDRMIAFVDRAGDC